MLESRLGLRHDELAEPTPSEGLPDKERDGPLGINPNREEMLLPGGAASKAAARKRVSGPCLLAAPLRTRALPGHFRITIFRVCSHWVLRLTDLGAANKRQALRGKERLLE
jgi:hypothetical protein